MPASLEIPAVLPAMTLPGVVFFPKAMMPLYVHEDRYRLMLKEVLGAHRMFALVGRREDVTEEEAECDPPASVASVGLIRVCRKNPDGTAFLLLQGVSRIRVKDVVQESPYRMIAVEPLETVVDKPMAGDREELRRLLEENHELGGDATEDMLNFLNPLEDDVAYVDLVAFTLCSEAMKKQRLLETLNLEERTGLLVEDLRRENEKLRLLKDALGDLPDEDFDAN